MAKLNNSELIKHKYKDTFVEKITKGIPLVLEEKDDANKNKLAVIECDTVLLKDIDEATTEDQLDALLKSNGKFKKLFKVKGTKELLTLSQISKESVKGTESRVGDANTTTMQELCSLKIIENLLENKRSTELSELAEIYPAVLTDVSWQKSFTAQEEVFKKIIAKYRLGKMKEYNRDGGFMDFISKFIRQFGISKKDSWNPADIWLIKDANVQKEVSTATTIYELNDTMVRLFNEGRLIGISLKKTKAKANYEETNITKLKPETFDFITGNVLVNLKNDKFINDELNYDQKYDGTAVINVQVRMYPKKAKSNIQISYKLKGGVAEFGKVPKAFRDSSIKKAGGSILDGKNVPVTIAQFEKEEAAWKKKIDVINRGGLFKTGVRNGDEFSNNVRTVFIKQKKTYHEIELCTKFQGIEIAYQLTKLGKTKVNELLTLWSYLAQKKGDEFGPFLKVY